MTTQYIKTCCTCKVSKDAECFGPSNQSKDGMKPRCRACDNEYAKQRRQNPEAAKIISEQRKAAYEKKMQDPVKAQAIRDAVNKRRENPEIRKKHNEYMRNLHAQKYNDPAEKQRRKEYWESKKQDPEYMAQLLERQKAYRKNPENIERSRMASRKHYATKIKGNEEKLSQMNEYSRKLYAENEAHRANVLRLSSKWRKENPEWKQAQNKYRQMLLANRIPSWANVEAINEFYKNKPKGYHVDHIIPIAGKKVSGLHVENNLQYLPALENLRKSNSFNVE